MARPRTPFVLLSTVVVCSAALAGAFTASAVADGTTSLQQSDLSVRLAVPLADPGFVAPTDLASGTPDNIDSLPTQPTSPALSGQSASALMQSSAVTTGPGNFCPNHVVGQADAFASRRFTVYETGGPANGPHFYTASNDSFAYDCSNGQSEAIFSFVHNNKNLQGSTITGQFQASKRDGVRRASRLFSIAPGTVTKCCTPIQFLPKLSFSGDSTRERGFSIPLIPDNSAFPYSLINTTGGLKALYRYAP